MNAIRGLLWIAAWTAVVCCAPREVLAQQPVAAILAEGRRQLGELKPDSAALFLVRVLDRSAGASQAERVRALVLLGIAELTVSRPNEARRLFQQALDRDPQLRVDSLAELHSLLVTMFDSVAFAQDSVPPNVYPERVVYPRPERLSCQPFRDPSVVSRAARIGGQVVLRFVVDTVGRAEPSSLQVLRTDHPGLVEAGQQTVLRCRYSRGEIDGKPVRVRVTLPITFQTAAGRAPRR